MKFEDNLPIYYQIEQQLYYDIVLGKLQPGEKMPSVRQLALDFTVISILHNMYYLICKIRELFILNVA